MDREKYNGWSSRETWLAKLWIDNDRESHFHWRSVAVEHLARDGRKDAIASLASVLESTLEDDAPKIAHGMYADLLSAAITRINCFEIATAMLDDLDEGASAAHETSIVVHTYTRAQAIDDSVLVDVSQLAKEAGIRYPVAMTAAAWASCVTVPEGANDQDETGRLWDVLNVLRFTCRNSGSDQVRFMVSVRTGEATSENVALKAICGPGDDPEPVITIMLPAED